MRKALKTQGAITTAVMGERAFLPWRGLRLKWAFAKKGLSYSSAIIDQIYRIYLSHNKVIHFRDGFPVFSLMTPAAFSKPAANFLARSLYRRIQNKNIPCLSSKPRFHGLVSFRYLI